MNAARGRTLEFNPRALAAEIIVDVAGRGRTLDDALEAAVADACRARPLPQRDLAFVQELAYGVVRWYPRLDRIADALLTKPLAPKERHVKALILIGLYQLDHLRVPDHAAVAETVAAAAAFNKPWATGILNAVLRRYQREGAILRAQLADDPVFASAHPAWLLARLRAVWPAQWQEIVAANNQRPPLALRVNLTRGTRTDYLDKLRADTLEAEISAYTPCGVVLREPVPVTRLPGFDAGLVSVQDVAAQHAAILLDAPPGARVLDACAAPGGKTGHILEHSPALAELVAVDIDAVRLDRVADNLKRLGLAATLVAGDAAVPAAWWDGRPFDRILLDAPCTGTGVIRRHPDIKLNRRPADVAQLADRQAQLLAGLWPLLAPGGKLLYVTCSVLPEENEAQMTRFVEGRSEARILPPDLACGSARPIGHQILPGEGGMDGFYYACVQKL